jgi:hypothetical protein
MAFRGARARVAILEQRRAAESDSGLRAKADAELKDALAELGFLDQSARTQNIPDAWRQ